MANYIKSLSFSPLLCTSRGSDRSPDLIGEDGTFILLSAIGQTPVRKSDKQRHAFRTEADTEGWRSGLTYCEDGAIMMVKGLLGILTAGTVFAVATNSFGADAAGALWPGFTPWILMSLGMGLVGLGLWGRKKIFQETPVDGCTPASGGKEGEHE
jgi:hypothetical protein